MADSERKAEAQDQGDDNRRHPRLSCTGIARIRVLPEGTNQTGSLVNLSKRGCLFVADKLLSGQSGSAIEIHLKVKGIDLRLPGIVRRIDKGHRAGIEFVELSARKCEQIDLLISELFELDKQKQVAHAPTPPPPTRGSESRSLVENIQREQQNIDAPVFNKLLRFYRG
ncbi:PilZ domain-containing protein [Occallatibacter riparius]|uniref:PilZ domain-containing protein n=1 Tax=Occallatibacter riparius TaxID=1002689 RepID=A0A9J7BRS3_9BACT|nr:PilZ domain-containing protein [Occallatibacter riparius]UWZ83622.1 PilZ domain-containing protein [Occallatibacter riparius]